MADYENPREIAVLTVSKIMDEDCYSHIVLREALDKYDWMDREQKAFITRLVSGTVEHCSEIDDILNRYSSVKVNKMKPFIRNLLRCNVYQILYMDSIPDRAVCSEALKLVDAHGMKGLKGFVNGVSRNIARNYSNGEIQLRSPEELFPDWMIDKLDLAYGSTLRKSILSASIGELQKDFTIRIIETAARREGLSINEVSDLLEQELPGCIKQDTDIPELFHILGKINGVNSIPLFSKGILQVQDKSSVMAGMALAPKKGDLCMDLCAAPGGKTVYIADQIGEDGLVISRDLSEYKCNLIRDNINRIGFENVEVQAYDASGEPDFHFLEKADCVLADVPCSGIGILRKKGDIRHKMTLNKQQELIPLQRAILKQAASYVKPGGVLVYSTCTIFPDENIENRNWFLENFPFKPLDLNGRLPDRYTKTKLPYSSASEGYIQLLSGVSNKAFSEDEPDTDGFFISAFIKDK